MYLIRNEIDIETLALKKAISWVILSVHLHELIFDFALWVQS